MRKGIIRDIMRLLQAIQDPDILARRQNKRGSGNKREDES